MHLVEANGLRRTYGNVIATARFDIILDPEEIAIVLGPNGCGKTTSIEMCLGLRRADEGSSRIFGLDPRRGRRKIARQIGIQLQGARMHPRARLSEQFAYLKAIHRDAASVERVIDALGLRSSMKSTFTKLSGGQQRRAMVASALCGSPRLAILDEPTSGVDPESRTQFWVGIRRLVKETGMGVLMTTHSLEEASRYGTRVLIMREGEVLYDGSIPSMVKEMPFDRVAVIHGFGARPPKDALEHLTVLQDIEDEFLVALHPGESLIAADFPDCDVIVRMPHLEDVYYYSCLKKRDAS